MERRIKPELKSISYEVFILALSFLSIFNWFLYFLMDDGQVLGVVFFVDLLISFIFLADFFFRLFTAESKRRYFFRQLGWLDLIGSIPLPQFRVARFGRIIRAIIMMMDLGRKKIYKQFLNDRVGTAVYLVAFLIIVVLEFGSLAVLFVEHDAVGATIQTPGDALWWSIVTMATVGYGDTVPVTGQGRLIGIFVITIGVALFGVVTGSLANRFVKPEQEAAALEEISQESADVKSLLNEVMALRKEQERNYSELESQLESLKQLYHSSDG